MSSSTFVSGYRLFALNALFALGLVACGGGGDSAPDAAPSQLGSPPDAALAATASTPTASSVDMAGPLAIATTAGTSLQPLTSFQSGEYLVSTASGQGETLYGVNAPPPPATLPSYDTDPGLMAIEYQGGTEADRFARIVSDPVKPTNKLLHFWLQRAHVDSSGTPTKGRVQLNMYSTDHVRAKEVRFTTRMLLGSDFGHLKSFPYSFGFLTLSEWWNNASWGNEGYPFRMSVNVVKPSAATGSALRFSVTAATYNLTTKTWNAPLWSSLNERVEVPVGKWVTLEYYIREGAGGEGRFYLSMKPDGGTTRVLFDVRNATHHPADPAPAGLTKMNPLKLYTAAALIDHVRGKGGALQVHWDFLSIRLCRELQPEATSVCAPVTAM